MRLLLVLFGTVAAAWIAAAFASGAHVWPASDAALRMIAADAFLLETIFVILAAPVAGAGAAAGAGGGARIAWIASGAAVRYLLPFTVVSIAAALIASSSSGAPASLMLRGHAALFAVGVGLWMLGAFFASICRDILDAAALAVVTSIVLSAAILVAGPWTSGLPQVFVDLTLLASPPIAVSSAAGLDLLRSEALYQLSPIAHRRFTYPAWHVTAASYAGASAVFLLAIRSLPIHERDM